MNQCQH